MKALALFSGGLDSALAIRLVQDQNIDVVGFHFTSPFHCSGDECAVLKTAEDLGISLETLEADQDYLEVIRNPRFGYGKNLNPCVDCRIFILKKAKAIAAEVNASFLFTGEVLDERPMSQTMKALRLIEREADLEQKILRPLSAKLLPVTEVEERGWIDRTQLLDIHGRSRRRQLDLAQEYGFTSFSTPAGGCLLTVKEFAAKMRDLLKWKNDVDFRDVNLLKIGRHFRLGNAKIIVGRDEAENNRLLALRKDEELCFEVPDCGSPVTLLQGASGSRTAIETAAALTLRYSDHTAHRATVMYGSMDLKRSITVRSLDVSDIESLRVK
jgi:tRNA U34 2-thiouridine synthase MnmA/TrmU